MEIMELFRRKSQNLQEMSAVTLAFLGDSVTQGCFEVYTNEEGDMEPVFDVSSAYHTYLKQLLAALYPSVPVHIINAGISGDDAPGGLKRIQRDILRYQPDFTVVCFGLNDCGKGIEKVQEYADALSGILKKLKGAQVETIFMTPNMMNTKVSCHLKEETLRKVAENTQELQNKGVLELYLERARDVCRQYQIPICDCYLDWKKLEEQGVDITNQLSNYINHPTRQMNWLFSIRLLETMMNFDN